jgi:hypothetical protein
MIGRDRLYEEGQPLLPGKYAGPVDFSAEEDDVRKAVRHYLYAWLFSIFVGPLVFTAYLFGNSGYLPIFAANIAAALAQHELVLKMIDKGYLHADEVLWRNSLEHSFILTHQVGVYVVLPTMVIFAVVSFRSKRVYRGMCLSLSAVAAIAGLVFGYYLFIMHFDVYRQFRNLDTYINIDPAMDVGGAYMDAGEVYFKEGSRVDTKRAIAVMSKDVFCAAPVVRDSGGQTQAEEEEGLQPPPPAGSVDWWVIGKNCCLPSGEQFTCGLAGLGPGVYPRAGLRLLPVYERHLYRLAVDEWSSKYDTPAKHPLFFFWDVDPLATVTAHTVTGLSAIFKGLELFSVVNILVTTFAVTILSMVQDTGPQDNFEDLEDAPIDKDGNAVDEDTFFDDELSDD